MKEMKAAEFKAKCLKVMDEVAQSGEGVVITKRGKPIARLLPSLPEPAPYFGWGAGAGVKIEYHGDIVAPIADDWEMDERNLFPEPTHTGADAERD